MTRTLTLASLALAAQMASAAPCPTRASWPTASWPSRQAEVASARASEIAALEAYAFTLTGADAERKGIRTDSVLIIQGGSVVYERYARGYAADKRHLAWSVTKSFTNALTGIAVGLGAVALDDSVCKHLPKLPQASCQIRLVDLLEFASGLDWKETYEGKSNQASSVLAMLYGEGHADMAAFIASHPLRDPPGTTFAYSSGDATLLSSAIGAALEPAHGADFPWPLLFDKIGIATAAWERDHEGHLVGSSYLYATPRDLARFGFFFLNDGCWAGERILPEGWVADSTAVSQPFLARRLDTDPTDVQGRQWWLNRPVPAAGIPTPFPDVPEDAYFARGHWGQSISVIPSLDLVVVRTGDDRDGSLDFDHFLSLAIAVGRP